MKKSYNSPVLELLNVNTNEYCLNGESIVDELGIVQTNVSDELLDEE